MNSSSTKKVLYINLTTRSYEVKLFPDLSQYLGGLCLGLKLYTMHTDDDPLIFSIGPLNGFFPFVSKTAVVLNNDGVVEDIYLGGSLSLRLKFSGIDALVLLGKGSTTSVLNILDEHVTFESASVPTESLGLPGKRSVLDVAEDGTLLLDGYFRAPKGFLDMKFKEKNLNALVLTGTKTFEVALWSRYVTLYATILQRVEDMLIGQDVRPSCSGCPFGCSLSQQGELGGNVLGHSLVACDYAQKMYGDSNVVFSCLNVLGYAYTHEDIERIPNLVQELLESL